jgi:alanine racemase
MDGHIPASFFRPTCATIDLGALEHNFKTLKGLVEDKVGILAMVKADAYGHGALNVSRKLVDCGAAALGVATVEEGLELRSAGIKVPVLVMGGLMGMGSPASGMMVGANLTPVIHSANVIDFLEAVAQAAQKRLAVHLKIDTGMGRLGVRPESLPNLLKRLSSCKWVYVEGVMTHLANATDEKFTSGQKELFLSCKKEIEQAIGPVEIWHMANSIATIKGEPVVIPEAVKCWARPGIALYGTTNGVTLPDGIYLKPVMSLTSKIALLKHVPENTPISYACTYVTRRPSRIGVVPIGYADGYRFALTGKAQVLAGGKRVPVIGRVTMDMIVIDVTDIPNAAVGDEVVLMGCQGGERITVDEIAGWAGTIPYEIFCGISARMPRIYKEG